MVAALRRRPSIRSSYRFLAPNRAALALASAWRVKSRWRTLAGLTWSSAPPAEAYSRSSSPANSRAQRSLEGGKGFVDGLDRHRRAVLDDFPAPLQILGPVRDRNAIDGR